MEYIRNLVDLLKAVYFKNKLLFVIALVVIALVIVGCTSQGGGSPPQGPIGGGCG